MVATITPLRSNGLWQTNTGPYHGRGRRIVSDRAAIIGTGQMGLVLADALAQRGMEVSLWGRSPDLVRQLAATRRSNRLLDFVLRDEVEVTTDPSQLFDGAALIVNGVPTQYIRTTWTHLVDRVPDAVGVVSVSKGIEIDTLLRPTQIICDALGESLERPPRPLCALSGPTIGAELARRMPATMVAAAEDPAWASSVQDWFGVDWIRVYRHDDLIGVELAGATKNTIALAAGMTDGMQLGYNAKSALLARGLAEISRLGAAMGANIDTFFGIAGVGDLATTCFSPEGRNRTCGERLGRGESLSSILDSMSSVVEGVPTTRSVVQLAATHGVEMPITEAVHSILFDGLPPREAIRALMSREPRAEGIG